VPIHRARSTAHTSSRARSSLPSIRDAMGGWRRAWRFLYSRDEFDLSGGMPRLVYIQSGVDREHELEVFLERVRDAGLSYKQFRSHAELESLLKDDLTVLLTERFFAPEDVGAVERRRPLSSVPLLRRAGQRTRGDNQSTWARRHSTVLGIVNCVGLLFPWLDHRRVSSPCSWWSRKHIPGPPPIHPNDVVPGRPPRLTGLFDTYAAVRRSSRHVDFRARSAANEGGSL
jgi:hypothetical protein